MTCGETQTGGFGPRPCVRWSVVTRSCPPLGEQKRPPRNRRASRPLTSAHLEFILNVVP